MNDAFRREMPLLCRGVRTLLPSEFTMWAWGLVTLESHCQYAGCFLGWLPRFVPESVLVLERIPFGDGSITIRPRCGDETDFFAVMLAYGLSFAQSAYLFSPSFYKDGAMTTAETVAARVESVLENGFAPKQFVEYSDSTALCGHIGTVPSILL